MKRWTIFAVLAFTLASIGQAQAKAEHSTAQDQIPLAGFQVFVPCTGDTITFTQGYLHDMFAITTNDNHISIKTHDQPHNLKGTDTSGRSYEGVGVTQEEFGGSLVNGSFHDTFINNFNMVGKSGAPSYKTHETSHITVTATGRVSTAIDHLRITCG
jgi:hypothetical protein